MQDKNIRAELFLINIQCNIHLRIQQEVSLHTLFFSSPYSFPVLHTVEYVDSEPTGWMLQVQSRELHFHNFSCSITCSLPWKCAYWPLPSNSHIFWLHCSSFSAAMSQCPRNSIALQTLHIPCYRHRHVAFVHNVVLFTLSCTMFMLAQEAPQFHAL